VDGGAIRRGSAGGDYAGDAAVEILDVISERTAPQKTRRPTK